MGTGELSGKPDEMLGVTCNGLASHPGGVAIFLVTSCCRNRDKPWQLCDPGSWLNLFFFLHSYWLNVLVGGKNLNQALGDWYQSSGQASPGCKTLIESECDFPHCAKTCPALGWKFKGQPSQGVPIQPGADRILLPRSSK